MGAASSRPHLSLITSRRPRLPAPSHGAGVVGEFWGDTDMPTVRERKDPHFSGPLDASFEGDWSRGRKPRLPAQLSPVLKFVGPDCGLWEASRRRTVPRGAWQREKKDFSLFSSSGSPEGWRDVRTGVWGDSPPETVQSAASCLWKEGVLMTCFCSFWVIVSRLGSSGPVASRRGRAGEEEGLFGSHRTIPHSCSVVRT